MCAGEAIIDRILKSNIQRFLPTFCPLLFSSEFSQQGTSLEHRQPDCVWIAFEIVFGFAEELLDFSP